MRKCPLFLLFFLASCVLSEASQKIVYLISPPRSLSVGFLRMMHARGDFKIYHEPTFPLYCQFNNLTFADDWIGEGTFQSFDEIKRAIFKENSNVFVKEMSFHLKNFIDEEFIKNPNVYFIFLLRNPHHSIISLYNRLNAIYPDFHEAIGYRDAYEIFQKIIACGARKPLILFSEELSVNPEKVVKTFCSYVGIEFDENALSWENLGDKFSGYREWHENKKVELTHHWHGTAIRSSKFEPLKTYEVDDVGTPTFSEIENLNDRRECEKGYVDSLPYYFFFKEYSQP
jgi:hypothetical protein